MPAGVFVGLAPNTSRGDMVRAILEGAAFGIRHNLDTFEQCGPAAAEVRIQGGAAKSAGVDADHLRCGGTTGPGAAGDRGSSRW